MTSNPFKAGEHDGVQTDYGTADDRILAVGRFDRTQCEAALQLPDLQKTVAAAVQRRLRHLDKVATVLHFTDHGQDFLRWELDAKGKVIGCGPFQAFVWCGKYVMRHEQLRAGDLVNYRTMGESTSVASIRYPLEMVVRIESSGPSSAPKKWTALCPQCGPVAIVQKTRPKSCQTVVRVGAASTRLCRMPLTQQEVA